MALFNPENRFWSDVSRAGDVVILSLCWLCCSAPIFTLGASTTALYDAAVHCLRRGDDPHTLFRFFRTFRDSFKPATLLTLAFLAAEAVLLCAWYMTRALALAGMTAAQVLQVADLVFLCVPLAIWLTAMAVLSRFTFNAKGLAVTAFQMTFRYLPSAAAVTAVVVLCVFAALFLFLPLVMIAPAIAALLASLFWERIFRRYLPKEETSEEETSDEEA